jgi:hypothetical protein
MRIGATDCPSGLVSIRAKVFPLLIRRAADPTDHRLATSHPTASAQGAPIAGRTGTTAKPPSSRWAHGAFSSCTGRCPGPSSSPRSSGHRHHTEPVNWSVSLLVHRFPVPTSSCVRVPAPSMVHSHARVLRRSASWSPGLDRRPRPLPPQVRAPMPPLEFLVFLLEEVQVVPLRQRRLEDLDRQGLLPALHRPVNEADNPPPFP